MTLETRLTRLLGLDHPIVLAPMGGASGGALAGAVSAAGGLGLIGGGYGNAALGNGGEDWIEAEFEAAGNQRVGIGFITWSLAERAHLLDLALARKPAAVMLSFGDVTPFADRVKASGAHLICQVQSVTGAREAARAGADIIVAQGTEAGGHGASGRATFTLVPAVVDAVAPLPVLAAGGIADGRGLAAALMLGADGVLLGTRFLASAEAKAHDTVKRRLVDAMGDQTLRTHVFDTVRGIVWPDGYSGRAIANAFTDKWHGRDGDLKANIDREQVRFKEAAAKGDTDTMVVFAGENIDLIEDIAPAGEIVSRIARDAEKLIGGGWRR